jgi:hypothetical protein
MALILSGSDGLSDVDGSAATPAIRGTDANTGIFFPAADTIAFSEGGTEAARFDSAGNLGIGVTSPARKLSVSSGSTSAVYLQLCNTTSGTGVGQGFELFSDGTNAGVINRQNGYIEFDTNNIERMRLTAAGDLGVGTSSPDIFGRFYTRSVGISSNGTTALQINGSTYGTIDLGAGGTRSTSITGSSTEAQFATVTAIPILFTTNGVERARITSGGDFGIGTTSPSQKLDSVTSNNSGTAYQLSLRNTSPNNNISAGIAFGFNTVSADPDVLAAVSGIVTDRNTRNGILTFSTAASGTLAERARIDSSGNLLVGTTSLSQSGTKMQVNGGVVGNQTFVFVNTQSSGAAYGIQTVLSYTPNDGTSRFMTCGDSTTDRIRLLSNGGIANYQANDSNLSDRKEKTNFAPAKSYLDVICAIPVQTYNYIDQNLEEDAGLTLGVVAQDVQAVAPELVTESNWGTKETPKMRLSIYQTDMQYALMKCIQEQQAIITSLTNRITALEQS